jgi:predicted dehydrogenase
LNKDDIKVALVGCGGVVRRYRKAYRNIPGVSVAVTVDVNAEEAKAAAGDTGAPKASQEFEDALVPDVDAVVISTPNYLHARQACGALRAGKHVLLQKPMAPSAAECDAILEARSRTGTMLGIYMNLLDHSLFYDMRRMVREGYLGKVALYSARLAHRGGLEWPGADRNWRASRARTGGGCFIQLGVHYQHLMRWLLGTSVAGVQALSRNVACPQMEGDDLTLAQYALANGALGEIQTSWCTQEEHVSLLGTRGSIHYRDNRQLEYSGEGGPFRGEAISLKGDGSLEIIPECLSPEWDDANNPYNQHRRFFAALAAGLPPDVTGEDGREDVRLVEACYRAAERGGNFEPASA